MMPLTLKYKEKVTTIPVTDNLIVFDVNPLPDERCLMSLLEFDHKTETQNIWYAGENIDLNSQIHINIADKNNIETTEPVKCEPYKCSRQLTKLERFKLIEQRLKSEGWL